MKNYKGFTVVEALLIVLIMTVIGFGGFYVWNENKTSETIEIVNSEESNNNSQPDNTPTENLSKPITFSASDVLEEYETLNTNDGWRSHNHIYNEVTDVYILGPSKWIGLHSGSFDESDNYFYLEPADDSWGVQIGAPEPDYTTGGRGGSLLDYVKYEEENGSLYLYYFGDSKSLPISSADYSSLSNASLDGIVRYDVDYYGELFNHAIFNTGNDFRTTAINIIAPSSAFTKEEFKAIAESVRLVRTWTE